MFIMYVWACAYSVVPTGWPGSDQAGKVCLKRPCLLLARTERCDSVLAHAACCCHSYRHCCQPPTPEIMGCHPLDVRGVALADVTTCVEAKYTQQSAPWQLARQQQQLRHSISLTCLQASTNTNISGHIDLFLPYVDCSVDSFCHRPAVCDFIAVATSQIAPVHRSARVLSSTALSRHGYEILHTLAAASRSVTAPAATPHAPAAAPGSSGPLLQAAIRSCS